MSSVEGPLSSHPFKVAFEIELKGFAVGTIGRATNVLVITWKDGISDDRART
ncbi:hypothetical protein [Thermococcus stetteri]|uniref:hypothetical protein n=1 Tax=Thermococcus stetteri TaxID=49900 RepID=UPI001AE45759|nr:hypothetical protein [Thermococcus stetteri]MBP1911717.1 hypothetical protein [Thermococcus stetteri]